MYICAGRQRHRESVASSAWGKRPQRGVMGDERRREDQIHRESCVCVHGGVRELTGEACARALYERGLSACFRRVAASLVGSALRFAPPPPPPEEVPELGGAEGGEEPSDVPLSPKQNRLRTDLEMWVMDALPGVFGVEDSDDLPEDLQEDGQAEEIRRLISEADEAGAATRLDTWLADATDEEAKAAFREEVLSKVAAIQVAGSRNVAEARFGMQSKGVGQGSSAHSSRQPRTGD